MSETRGMQNSLRRKYLWTQGLPFPSLHGADTRKRVTIKGGGFSPPSEGHPIPGNRWVSRPITIDTTRARSYPWAVSGSVASIWGSHAKVTEV